MINTAGKMRPYLFDDQGGKIRIVDYKDKDSTHNSGNLEFKIHGNHKTGKMVAAVAAGVFKDLPEAAFPKITSRICSGWYN